MNRAQVAHWFSRAAVLGHVIRIIFSGRYATAVFRLGNRGKTKCDAPGALAAARFEIVNGKIASWVQVDGAAEGRPAPSPDLAQRKGRAEALPFRASRWTRR